MVLLTLLLVTSIGAAIANNTRCYQCANVRDPAECTTVTECPEGQQCMVERFVTSTGTLLYNSRCQSKQKCDVSKRDVISDAMTRRSDSDSLVCVHCCDGEFCNDRGCGSTVPTTQGIGPTCFNCETDGDPGNCSRVARCDAGQLCLAYAVVGKRKRNAYCHVCCNDDYCNDQCENSPIAPIKRSTSTRTTTTRATTTKMPTAQERCQHYHYTYDALSNLCYKFHYEKKTWDEGNDICKQEHGTLAIIDTQAKWEYLKDKISRDHHLQYRIYIGGRDTNSHDDNYYWPNGERVSFAAWTHWEQDRGIYDCIYLDSRRNFVWNDYVCDHYYLFICTID